VITALVRLMAELGLVASWLAIFFAAVIAVFVLYVGITLWAILRPGDLEHQILRYQVLRDLLDLFRRRS
jgi:hypothetical protein